MKHLLVSLATVLTIGSLAFLVSCSMASYGTKITEEQKAQIIKGKTTKAWFLKEIGEPDQRIDLGDGKEQFSYIYAKGTYKGVVVTHKYTEFWVDFDKDGAVADFGERPTTKKPTFK